ncbi:PfkB family carbohydrate kinase [Paractinoplanes rishiriensis]|uniref:Ribokinase n=1 Tax=Paractinoplanes rishiriensis TaxID=1050105 RepID=A0A919JU13_9ACTN|nr:PfkB family carbohydrate kinase [Actinoplanes rishiriensis]GIE93392.1 ribokinase [Actinoplanes rishiriensis]
MDHTATVVGQLARDLVVTVDRLPAAGTSAAATGRREQLGGKGANQAVALAQLGVRPALVAVAGDDVIGDVLLAQARADGIDTRPVIRRRGALTGLIVEILEEGGDWRYVEHLPPEVLLTESDVEAARSVIAAADAVLVQLQQPRAAALAAARIAHEAGRLVVLDGAVEDERILAFADVLRADAREAKGLNRETLAAGPSLLALAEPDGNALIWPDGEIKIPLGQGPVVDTTGGGDSFTAALTEALLRGLPYPEVAKRAGAASGSTVAHVSGRPQLG